MGRRAAFAVGRRLTALARCFFLPPVSTRAIPAAPILLSHFLAPEVDFAWRLRGGFRDPYLISQLSLSSAVNENWPAPGDGPAVVVYVKSPVMPLYFPVPPIIVLVPLSGPPSKVWKYLSPSASVLRHEPVNFTDLPTVSA